MFSFLCKKQLNVAASNVRLLGIPQKLRELPQDASSLIRLFSSVKSESPATPILHAEQQCVTLAEQQYVTLPYLINSCRLSPRAAQGVSRKLSNISPEKLDLVWTLLRNHGLSDVHITKIVSKAPSTLLACPEKNILPKLKFFHSIGMPDPVLAHVISRWPKLLGCSLEKQIIPYYECLKNLLEEDDKVFTVFKRSAGGCLPFSLLNTASNIAILRDYGVSKSNISFLVVHHSRTVTMRSDGLVNIINRVVIEFGIDISKLIFVEAIRVIYGTSESNWKRRKEVYGRWWSESEIQMAFSNHPVCMALSENKITSTMEFLVHEMNYEPKVMARDPVILFFSLEKRIMPRCRVYKLLRLRGLLDQPYGLTQILYPPERKFWLKFIAKHEHLPHILDVYSGKLGLTDLGFTSEELSNFKPL